MDFLLVALTVVMGFVLLALCVTMWQVYRLNKHVYGARVQSFAPRPEAFVAGVPAHTHTFSAASEHEEHGKHVVVKKCWCGEVIRDVG